MGINVQISTRLQDYKKLWNVADPKETGATRARSTCQDPAPLNLNIFIIYRREKKGEKKSGHHHYSKFYSLSLTAKLG